MFGLNAVAVTQLTLARIKKIYSKVDNKAIAKHFGMGTGENATPIGTIHILRKNLYSTNTLLVSSSEYPKNKPFLLIMVSCFKKMIKK